MKKKAKLMHYASLDEFNSQVFNGLLLRQNVKGQQVNFGKLTHPDESVTENFWGYVLEKDNEKYLLSSEDSNSMSEVNLRELLPIRPKATTKVSYNNDVYNLILNYDTVDFTKKKSISFKELVERLAPFNHTAPEQYTLFSLVAITQYFSDTCNFRVSTRAGFGKDSMTIHLNKLFSGAYSIVSPTIAKLEYLASTSKMLSIHEVVDIKPTDWRDVEQFLLSVGDFKHEVSKRSRGYDNVGEFINVKQMGLALCYNDIDHYPNGDYFDAVTKGNVKHRFVPFRFAGELDENFSQVQNEDVSSLVSENIQYYKDILHSFEYYNELHESVSLDEGEKNIPSSISSNRHKSAYVEILKTLKMYAETEDEFTKFSSLLKNAYQEYKAMLRYPDALEGASKDQIERAEEEPFFQDKLDILRSPQKSTGGLINYG